MDKLNNGENPLRKQILELGPLVLFFVGNLYFGNIFWATGILVVATLISIIISLVLDKRIPIMASFGCAAVVFFGVLC